MTLTGYVSSTFCLPLLDLVGTRGVFTSQSSHTPLGLSSWEYSASFIEEGVAVEREEAPQRHLDVFHIKLQRERLKISPVKRSSNFDIEIQVNVA